MTEQNKKGFFSKLFSEKPKQGGCCNVQFEEVPEDEKKEDKKNDSISKEKKTKNPGCCG